MIRQWILVLAHGRINDTMAKLQFLRVGWGGVRMMTFLELARMLDARNCVCLVSHCTHAGCYACHGVAKGGVGWGGDDVRTVFVLSLHACLDARPVMGWVGWGGAVGMMTFVELAHMLDAAQLCLSCHCTHAGCYACHGVARVVWGGVGMMTFVELAHMLDATQLCLSCHCTHAGR